MAELITESGRRVWTIEQAIDEANFWYRHAGLQKEANAAAYEAADERPLKTCVCRCGSPQMRDGMNVVLLRRPPHMYPTHRGDLIEVDRCVAPVVEWVWSQGVWTGGACCGHTQARPTIAPMDDSIELMHRLGYEAHEDAPHIFYVDRINEVRP